CEWGMSRLGAISFGEKDQPVFIGREVTRQDDFSDQTAMIIDTEVKRILDEAYKETLRLLKTNLGKLKLLAEELLHKETMDSDEIYSLLKMKKPVSEKMDLGDGNEPPKASPVPPKEDKQPASSIFHPEPPPLPT
ncbi:MAG: cell division protein FtsH, partial [Spirochaetia bacterium]|nr:cell division protein FtsH [Spirochaetia bacterium]